MSHEIRAYATYALYFESLHVGFTDHNEADEVALDGAGVRGKDLEQLRQFLSGILRGDAGLLGNEQFHVSFFILCL